MQSASELGFEGVKYVLPEQTEFAKLKLNYTMMGKRNLKEMVDTGVVQGWDDPRMPTLAGMRRRGFTPASIRNFCESVGVSRSESVVDMSMLEHAIRDDLDKNAPRAMCVLSPLRIVLENLDPDHSELLSLQNHPKDEKMGRRDVPFTRDIFIDRGDFEEDPPVGFKRLVPGGEVRLRGSYVIKCEEILRDSEGEIIELICSADRETLGRRPEGRKVKGVIHWVSAVYGQEVSLMLYDRLFMVENPEAKEITDYKEFLNPESLSVVKNCVIEPSALESRERKHYQFEREGYFFLDIEVESKEYPVFNRTITLRDSWGK